MLSELKNHIDQMETYSALLSSVELIIEKPLNSQLVQDVFMLSEEYGFDNDRIREFFCALKEKKTFNHNYLMKMADTWKESGVNTCQQSKEAEQKKYDEIPENMLAVFSAFGVNPRIPSDYEYELFDTWTGVYLMDMQLIVEACKRTIEKINDPSFAYTNAILKDWHNRGLRTLDDYEQSVKKDHEQRDSEKTKRIKKKNSFHNFTERTYDYDELIRSIQN